METAGIRAATWVVGKALSPLSGGVLEAWGASSMLGSNMEALKMQLLYAQAMLNNVRGREIHNPALGELLDKLQELAYGADDVLDELDYFRIQDELDGTYHAAEAHAAGCVQNLALNARHTARAGMNKLKVPACSRAAHTVGKHFPCYSFPQMNHAAPAPRLKFDRVQMSTKLRDIVEQLKPICAMVSTILNLELLGSNRTPGQETAMNRAQTTPEIIEPKLYGRDSQKNIVVAEIVNGECCPLSVLPVVGPGGIGKTTFIQHVYEQMKSHFQVPIWICVSLDFNANRLAKDIVKKIPKVDNENTNCSDEELIMQRIKGKRVLLVLDDVWTHPENEWKKVSALFKKEGAKGNMVIVTTRIPEVANKVKTTDCPLELDRLSPNDIMSLFEKCVFGGQIPWVDYPGLDEVGRKIVAKLISILESKEWESQTNDNDIMPALKLSFDYLPFHLQRCFLFCALFPEDYEFGSEELVYFWIGLDILNSYDQKRERIEDVGLRYLNDLVNHGFFKMNKKESERPYYIIHDLLHELAVKVSSHECLSIYSSNVQSIQIPPSVRHLSIIVDNADVKDRMSFEDYNGNLSALSERLKVEHLRTLMVFGDNQGSFAKTFGGLFKEASALRVIFLSEPSYNLEDILHNFSKLVHLRYLRIKPLEYMDLCLPSALFRLYHLEVIDLQSASRCAISTRHTSNLVKIRHFLLPKEEFHLQSDIFGVGKLKLLQELREFRVRKESEGFEPSQLGQLKEIGGSLVLYNLEKMQTKEEANESKLIHKKHLRELVLEWDAERSNKNPVQEENILESLVPHSSLEELRIKGHAGTNCPSWLSDNLSVRWLQSLCLDGVSWNNLPPLGEMRMVNDLGEEYQACSSSPPGFHNLKKLQLSNMSSLIKWIGNGACPFFSHLEVLIVRDCSELAELPFSPPTSCQAQQEDKMAWFPSLRELVIVDCPKLASLPPLPWRILGQCSAQIVKAGSGFEQLVYTREDDSVLSMKVEGKGGQGDVLWNGLNFSNLTDLENMHMTKCPPLPFDALQLLASLKRIQISGSSSILPPVQGEGHGIYRFPCEDLGISECDTSGEELTLLLSFLPNLSALRISYCENITGLGVAGHAETVSGERRQQTRCNEEIMTAGAAAGLMFLPLQLQVLIVSNCPELRLLSNPPHDDHTGEVGLQRLCSLRVLDVFCCPEFLSFYSSSSFFPFPTSLQDLSLDGLNHTEILSNLTSLNQLYLSKSGGSRDEGLWPLLAHGRLTQLSLYTPDFFTGSDLSRPQDKEMFFRSSKLWNLETGSNTGVLAAPICSLLSSTLTRFELSFHDKVERLTKEQEEALQLLTSLQELRFAYGEKLQRLPAGLHKLLNLKKLEIYWCLAIRSLPSLPSSLQELEIRHCHAIKSLPNSLPTSLEILKVIHCYAIKSLPNSLPGSLEKLEIIGCKAIKSLPKGGLPSSMLELDVHRDNSEELKRACRKLIGTIPIIKA